MTTRVRAAAPEHESRDTRVLSRMPRWRYWLYAWMARHEYAEWRRLGIPADRVVVVDVPIEPEEHEDAPLRQR